MIAADAKTLTVTSTGTNAQGQKLNAVPDEDLLEYFCIENEKDAPHYQP